MDNHQKFFEPNSTERLSEGFEAKSQVLRAVAMGDTALIQDAAEDYIAAMGKLLGDDLAYAKESACFIFAQVSAAGTMNGLEDWAAHRLKKGYYYAVDEAESIPEILDFMKNFILDFTDAVFRLKVESKYSPVIRAACEYINLHMGDKLTIKMIADDLHFSESYISHKFKEEVGMPIMDYLIRQRIEESKVMLHQKIPTVEVAQRLGFSSQSHFTRVFHKWTGMTPGEWRKQI